MSHRRWTLLIVTHGSEATRSIVLTTRGLRALVAATSLVGAVALAGLGASATFFLFPAAARTFFADKRLLVLQSRLESLGDTLAAISRRDEQIKLLAGLSTADSSRGSADSAAGDPSTTPSLAGAASTDEALTLAAEYDVDGLIRRANTLAASFAEVSDTLANHVERVARIPSIMPTAGWLSSAFSRSRFHPILHTARPHEGIDVSAPMGAPIVAPAAGTVRRVAREVGYGLILEIDHGNGIVTRYAHCSRALVSQGQRVKRGQGVAEVGNSGLSTGPHLHYEIHVNGKVVDPLTYVLPSGAIPD